ncbi:MAG: IclR family transcriptional regulator [Halodesulfurarchaeum sp.]
MSKQPSLPPLDGAREGYRIPQRTPPPDPTNPVKSAAKTMEIIEILKRRGGATVGEVATALGVSKGTASNYLSTLRDGGYVTRLATEEYDVGLRLLDVCTKSVRGRELLVEASRHIDALAEKFEGIFTVMAPEHGYGYCLYSRMNTPFISRNRLAQGTRRYLHCNGPGLAILSTMDETAVEAIIASRGLKSCESGCQLDCPLAKHSLELPVEREHLFDRLDRVSERGYAVTDHGQLSCLGVAILGPDGAVVGSVGVLGPGRMIGGESGPDPSLLEAMKDAATAIGINIV